MEKIQWEKITDKLTAVRPIYLKDTGKACEVYLNNGETIIDNRDAKTILKDLAGFLAVDLGSLRKFCSHRLAAKNTLPLPLTPKILLVPLRLRKPKVSKDSATGYINYFDIANAIPKEGDTVLELTCGRKITCHQSIGTVQVHLVYARLIYREWQSVYVNPYIKEVGNELYKSAKLDIIRKIMGQ